MTSKYATYAVDLSNEGVSLWHRIPHKAWQLLGKVSLNSPDFSAEIESLKDGHEPDENGWFMAQVRIPRSEVYVSDLALEGAKGAKAASKTNAFLARNTPYLANDLIFDLENPEGSNVSYVAAVTRQTLTEAKEFIRGYGFKALYYTSKIDKADFPRAPRFYGGDKTADHKPAPDDIVTPPPPRLSAKALNPPVVASPASLPNAPVTAIKTDFIDFSTVRSKALSASKPDDNTLPKLSTLTPPPPRISISAPDAHTNEAVPIQTKPVTSPVNISAQDSTPIKMSQGSTSKPDVRGFFKLRYILIFTFLLLLALLYWFYITLFDGKAEIARLQMPSSVSEPQIATSPPALKHRISKDKTPGLPQNDNARNHRISTLKKPSLANAPAPVVIAGDSPDVASVFVKPDTPDTSANMALSNVAPIITDASPPALTQLTRQDPVVNSLTEVSKTNESPSKLPLQQDIVVAALPVNTFTAKDRQTQATAQSLIPTTNGTAGPEGITLFAGQPDIVPPRREQIKISTDPLKDILPIMRSAEFVEQHKAEIANQATPNALTDMATDTGSIAPATDLPDTTGTAGLLALADPALKKIQPQLRPDTVAIQAKDARNSLVARADPALAGIKPKIRPDKLSVPENMAAGPPDIKVAVRQVASDTLRPHRRPKSLRNTVANFKAEAGQTAALGTSIAGKSSPVNIQKEATERASFSKRRISLVGVYGTPSKRRALVRLPSGRYVKVEKGQKFSGWKVAAIGESTVRITKGSRNQVLRMPK